MAMILGDAPGVKESLKIALKNTPVTNRHAINVFIYAASQLRQEAPHFIYVERCINDTWESMVFDPNEVDAATKWQSGGNYGSVRYTF